MAGTSSSSFRLSFGQTMVSMPARRAARIFSFSPPMGSTFPRRVISPVMATEHRTGRLVKTDSMAVAMVIPAEGPSFGMAPSGTCTCRSWTPKKSSRIP